MAPTRIKEGVVSLDVPSGPFKCNIGAWDVAWWPNDWVYFEEILLNFRKIRKETKQKEFMSC